MSVGRPKKALILVGGYGTRLRPFTLSTPKPLVPFANLPMIMHQILALIAVGIVEVILAVNYRPEMMVTELKQWEIKLGIKISYSIETEPLGTAGPLALAAKLLAPEGMESEPFYVLNSDVIADFPFEAMLSQHAASGAEATILVTRVAEPSKYGVIVFAESGKGGLQIERFVEKPKEFISNAINAGIYLLSPGTLKRIQLQPTSIEKEIFPAIAAEGRLFAFDLQGYWMDVGQPADYLIGAKLHLAHLAATAPKALAHGSGIAGNVLIADGVEIGENCLIGPDVIIGKGCVIGAGVRLASCTLMEGCRVASSAFIENSIIGWKCSIGRWCRIDGGCNLAEDVSVADCVYMRGATVLMHKAIAESVREAKIIM